MVCVPKKFKIDLNKSVVQTFHVVLDQFIAVKITAHYTFPFILYYFNQCNTKSVTYNKYI